MSRLDLGTIGVSLDIAHNGSHLDEARELERLGYDTLWIAGGQLDRLERVSELIGATTDARVGTAIISPDVYDAGDVVRLRAELQGTAEERFVVGLGGSQGRGALQALGEYLDRLDHADPPVPAERRLLAALGPRKLEVARDRCAGALTLLVTPDSTRHAREALGDDSTLVVDQFVVLDDDPETARRTARGHLEFLARVAGYRAHFTRMGFADDEVAALGDRLVDELVAWGDVDAIIDRVEAHRQAGADHVILAVLSEGYQPTTLDVARRLAGRLLEGLPPR